MIGGDPFVDASVAVDFFEAGGVEILVVLVVRESVECVGVWGRFYCQCFG